jgi:hypothetical protein
MRRFAPSATAVVVLGASLTAAATADDLVPPGAELELLYTRTAPIRGGLSLYRIRLNATGYHIPWAR